MKHSFQYNHLEIYDLNHVLYMLINNVERKNSLCQNTITEINHLFDHFEKEPAYRVLVMSGKEKDHSPGRGAFCAGADIKEFNELFNTVQEDDTGFKNLMDLANSTFNKISTLSKPVIAAVNGYALGGGFELALACDIILACQSARFGLPEISLSLIPAYGGIQRVINLIGKHNALDLMLTGKIIPVEEAYRLGFVQYIFPNEEFHEQVRQYAEGIAIKAPLSAKYIKMSAQEGSIADLNKSIQFDVQNFMKIALSHDALEGCYAFAEKRQPHFTGQ